MTNEEFLKQVEQKVNFYTRYARLNRLLHLCTQTIILILAALTPIFAAMEADSGSISNSMFASSNITLTLISASILAVLEGLSRLFRFQNLWLRYRKTANLLSNEHRQYLHEVGEYKDHDLALLNFKEKFETIIATEQSNWYNSMQRD